MTQAQSSGDALEATWLDSMCWLAGVRPANHTAAWMRCQLKWNQDWSKVQLTERLADETAARSRQRRVYISLKPLPLHHCTSQPLLLFFKTCTSVRSWAKQSCCRVCVMLKMSVVTVTVNLAADWIGIVTAGKHTTGQNSIWQRDSTFTLVKPHDDFTKEIKGCNYYCRFVLSGSGHKSNTTTNYQVLLKVKKGNKLEEKKRDDNKKEYITNY